MANARILVVDDEPDVLRMVATLLERAGYETVTALGPLHALEIITIRGGFDLVVSEVIMPEMCGPELADQIRLLSPSSPILLMSGSAGHPMHSMRTGAVNAAAQSNLSRMAATGAPRMRVTIPAQMAV